MRRESEKLCLDRSFDKPVVIPGRAQREPGSILPIVVMGSGLSRGRGCPE
jgi:hypothetical protein